MSRRCARRGAGFARLLGVGWLALGLLAAPAAGADDPEGWGYRLANELMSPYCPGRALAECPSPQADQLRRWILDQEKSGASRAEVEELLFARFGDGLRQSPRAQGVGLVAYGVPVLLFVAGGALVVLFLRRQRPARASAAASRPVVLDPDLERRVDEELGLD